MKITSSSQLLASLTSLVDPNQRQQQQDIQARQQEKERPEVSRDPAREAERQGRIEANRTALAKLQEKLKADNLERLRTELSIESLKAEERGAGASQTNLNLRESPASGGKPVDTRPGQIIDIRV